MRRFSQNPHLSIAVVTLLLAGCTETGLEPPVVEPIPAPVYAALSVGETHACALDEDGRAFCWGANDYGELGDGSTAARSAPTPVGGGHRFATIDAGVNTTCGITRDRELLCWDAWEGSIIPAPVGPEGTSWHSVSADVREVCALDADGKAWCGVPPAALTAFEPGMTWKSIRVDARHSCGITTADRGYCWGWNFSAELGVEGMGIQFYPTPVPVPGDDTWSELVAGNEITCGIAASGDTRCWGLGLYGAFGADTIGVDEGWHGTGEPQTLTNGALRLSSLSTAAVGWHSYADRRVTCGMTSFGDRATAVCWGDFQPPMNIGYGRHDWVTVQPGDELGCGLTTDGRVMCWEPRFVRPHPYFPHRGGFVQLLYPELELRELPAPLVEWRDT